MQRMWIVIAGVVVLALVLAGGGYWWLRHSHKQQTVAGARPHLIGALGDTATVLDTAAPDQDKLCAASLSRALDFGAVPPGARLANSEAQAGQAEGHFVCEAIGAEGKYTLSIDTSCPNSDAKTCFSLDSIRRDDGKFVYQREM
jgi:hypothetical protein